MGELTINAYIYIPRKHCFGMQLRTATVNIDANLTPDHEKIIAESQFTYIIYVV